MQVGRNNARAQRVIDFIERNLKVTVGDHVGEPFLLAPFQRAFIEDVFAPIDLAKPEKRLINKAILSVGRKCGKSEIAAAIVLACLIGPESERNGWVVSAATTHKQARIVFDKVVQFIEMSPVLKKYLQIGNAKSTIYVKPGTSVRAAGSKYEAIANKPGGSLGLNPSVCIFDELTAANDRKFYDALVSSQKARPNPLFLVISTQNAETTHVLSEIIDAGLRRNEDGSPVNPRTVVHLHAADEGCDLLDRAQHRKATPAIGLWIDEDVFYQEAIDASMSPSEEAQFRLYALNQRVAAEAPVVSRLQWQQIGPEPLPVPAIRTQATFEFDQGEDLITSLDLSARTDLTCMLAISRETSGDEPARIKAWFWKPKVTLVKDAARDGLDYPIMARQGWLIPVDSPDVDPDAVVSHLVGLQHRCRVSSLVYDRDVHLQQEFFRALDRAGVHHHVGPGSGLEVKPWGQGFQGMHIGITAIEHYVLNQKIRHDGNPILEWNMANARVLIQPSGIGRKLVKMSKHLRIDGSICLAMTLGYKHTMEKENAIANPYDDDAFSLTALL